MAVHLNPCEFKDFNGHVWTLSIDPFVVQSFRESADIDLLNPDHFASKLSDPVTLVQTLYTLCEDQAEEAGVTPEQFARGMRGNTLDDASRALWHAVADMLPEQKAVAMREYIAAMEGVGTMVVQQFRSKVAELKELAESPDDTGGD